MRAYLEISALFDRHWTGIPVVIAALVESARKDADIEWRYLYQSIELPQDIVDRLLSDRSDINARGLLERRISELVPVDYDSCSRDDAVFTSIKPIRGLFKRESLIVYDLSPLLTPQFHHQDTISHFGNRFRSDVETSCHFFPISRAVRDDLRTYFDVPSSDMTVLPLGVSLRPEHISLAQAIAQNWEVEPYVVVLGTLEPRKNGRLILEYVARNPGFARRFRIVFVGRDGWLDERDRLLAELERSGTPKDRVTFTGYVSEQEKVGLLFNAAFCIYASFFEGFGLPILEAALLGKLVVCSNTSSMPEVAPDFCVFFDPLSVVDFARAISIAERRAPHHAADLSLEAVARRVAEHGWGRTYQAIKTWVIQP